MNIIEGSAPRSSPSLSTTKPTVFVVVPVDFLNLLRVIDMRILGQISAVAIRNRDPELRLVKAEKPFEIERRRERPLIRVTPKFLIAASRVGGGLRNIADTKVDSVLAQRTA
jgi:hypothetical protein